MRPCSVCLVRDRFTTSHCAAPTKARPHCYITTLRCNECLPVEGIRSCILYRCAIAVLRVNRRTPRVKIVCLLSRLAWRHITTAMRSVRDGTGHASPGWILALLLLAAARQSRGTSICLSSITALSLAVYSKPYSLDKYSKLRLRINAAERVHYLPYTVRRKTCHGASWRLQITRVLNRFL